MIIPVNEVVGVIAQFLISRRIRSTSIIRFLQEHSLFQLTVLQTRECVRIENSFTMGGKGKIKNTGEEKQPDDVRGYLDKHILNYSE